MAKHKQPTAAGAKPTLLYHVTNHDAAQAILRDGFRDIIGSFGTDRRWSGVWLSDGPLDRNDTGNVAADTVLALSFDCERDDLSDYEWVRPGQSHCEWLMPAAAVNGRAKVAITQMRNEPVAVAR